MIKLLMLANFLGFPTWYEYLPKNTDGSPSIKGIGDIWLIVAAAINILLRLAALVAVFGVLYGGVLYVTSQGEPEKNAKARSALVYALGGLILAVIASAVVSFIAGSFNG
ncbi:MAG TPA: hypothetical protein VHD60_01790 [Candidatus Saccharimonadales bacterium]|nr:hypothetical protein [Candidatus Saccharimonadales bacterium]